MRVSVKKAVLMAAIVVMPMVFNGCGSKKEQVMKEFKSADGNVSIMLDENWEQEDVGQEGAEGFIVAGSSDGTEGGFVFQVGKEYADSLDSVKEIEESAYGITDKKAVDAPEISGISIKDAYTCKIHSGDGEDEVDGDGYVLYGESDQAYYAIIFVAEKMTDNKQASYAKSCTTLKVQDTAEDTAE